MRAILSRNTSICFFHGIFTALCLLNSVLPASAVIPDFQFSVNGNQATLDAYSGSATLVTVPATYNGKPVTTIGIEAFYASSVTSVTLPDSVTFIDLAAFSHCANLGTIKFGKGLTVIGENAFEQCESLSSLTIPDNVVTISGAAFGNCYGLRTVTFNKRLKTIESDAFMGCSSLTSLTIPDNVTTLGMYAFSSCTSLRTVVVGQGITVLPEEAFFNCTALTSVTLGRKLTQIGQSAFNSCPALRAITLPASLTQIDTAAFSMCPNLAAIVIPAGVTNIDDNAFSADTSLAKVTLPRSLKRIGVNSFNGCTALKSILLPATLATIDDSAFAGSGLTTVTIPSSVTTFGGSVFSGCFSLTSANLGTGVPSIQGGCFSDCSILTAITIPDQVTYIGANAFYRCFALAKVTLGKGVTELGAYAFAYCELLPSITLPDNVRFIGDECFTSDSALANITLGNGLYQIGTGAFSSCDALTSLVIPDSVVNVNNSFCSGCSNLTTVIFGRRVDNLQGNAFQFCTSLAAVTFRGNAPHTVGQSVFIYYKPIDIRYYEGATGFTTPIWSPTIYDTYTTTKLTPLPKFTSEYSANGNYNLPFSFTLTADNSPTNFNATNLPPGLTLNPSTGVISGIPTQPGDYFVAVTASATGATTATDILGISVDKAPATLTVSNTTIIYDGKPHAATATTTPAKLPVTFTYNGDAAIPTVVGTYAVVAAINDVHYTGTANGSLSITPVPPLVTALAASAISASSATLNASINPKGSDTQVAFQYGTTTAYGSTTTPTQSVGNGTITTTVSSTVAFATSTSATVYHYRAAATSAGGTIYGADKVFTLPAVPSIVSDPVVSLEAYSAHLSFSINPDGTATSVYFEYYIYPQSVITTRTQNLGSGKTPVNAVLQLPSLDPNTVVHFRIILVGAAGTIYGPDTTFTTLNLDESIESMTGYDGPFLNQKIATLGNPALNSGGRIVSRTTLTGAGSATNSPAICFVDGGPPIAYVGGFSDDGVNTFASLSDPLINGSTQVAFKGTLKARTGQVTTANSNGIWTGDGNSLQLVARQGAAAPGTNGTFGTFTSLGLTDNHGTIFQATLNAGAGISAANNVGIWEGNTPADLTLLLRLGQVVSGKTITAANFFPTLPVVGSQTRCFNPNGQFATQATFSDKTTGIVQVSNNTASLVAVSGDPAFDIPDAKFASFGPPTIYDEGWLAFTATLTPGIGGVTTANNSGIWAAGSAQEIHLITRTGSPAPGTASTFANLGDPVYNGYLDLAFQGTLTIGIGGVTASNANGIWFTPPSPDGSLSLVVRQGSQAPGCPPGATFNTFTAFALPMGEVAGVAAGCIRLFASLNLNPAAGVTASNNTGIWAVDNNNVLQLIVRTGDIFEGKVISNISFLSQAPIVGSQSRGFASDSGNLVYLATFADKTTAIIEVTF